MSGLQAEHWGNSLNSAFPSVLQGQFCAGVDAEGMFQVSPRWEVTAM